MSGKSMDSVKIHTIEFSKSLMRKLYGLVLEVERILIFHNNCVFPYYGKCLANPWIVTKSIPLNSVNP